MGTDRRSIEITANVSRHNSWRDTNDEAMLALLKGEILRLLQEDDRFSEWARANRVEVY